MGVLKKLTSEYFGKTERLEDRVIMDGVVRADFTDMNGKHHKDGYRVENGDDDILYKLIRALIGKRGPECDLNDVDVSNVTDTNRLFYKSDFNGDISGWNVSGVTNMYAMFWDSDFNGDISGWEVDPDCVMTYIFKKSPLENNPPKWYNNRM
jgi:surface protein